MFYLIHTWRCRQEGLTAVNGSLVFSTVKCWTKNNYSVCACPSKNKSTELHTCTCRPYNSSPLSPSLQFALPEPIIREVQNAVQHMYLFWHWSNYVYMYMYPILPRAVASDCSMQIIWKLYGCTIWILFLPFLWLRHESHASGSKLLSHAYSKPENIKISHCSYMYM